ncbi:upstream activation factor subunit spp27 [Cocos nucifera]|uniref:Upstream activation factor subunit spp27 n=1 Tax=Cocos nucifera TaxID=13894 RepID=A0A8K0IM35_COCNU|nr:upstream activation factor subunit spp27 [Cocos nucifera]
MSWVFEGCRVLMKTARTRVKAAAAPTAAGAAAAATKPKYNPVLRPLPVSPAMRKFVGAPEMSRAQVLKKIWEHIKLNQLQNPTNKKEIHCDEKLKTIFDGRDKVGMLEIARLITPHFQKSS